MKTKIILAGGSGFLGERLIPALMARNYEVVILTRAPKKRSDGVREVEWDGKNQGAWSSEMEGAHAILNLAGKNVNCRSTPENKRAILHSRVNAVRALGEARRACQSPPTVWVQASSLAIYGNLGSQIVAENFDFARSYPATVCTEWEKTLWQQEDGNLRTVALRIGLVLDRGKGALGVMDKLVQSYLGGTVGTGRQWVSWIHWADMNRVFLRALENPDCCGAYNATAPHPVTNAVFMRELRRNWGRPWCPPAPAFLVRLGARWMGTEGDLALMGRRCIPQRMLEEGFSFNHPELRGALEALPDPRKK